MRLIALLLAIGLQSAACFAQTAAAAPDRYYGKWLGKWLTLLNGTTLATGIEVLTRADAMLGAVLVSPDQDVFHQQNLARRLAAQGTFSQDCASARCSRSIGQVACVVSGAPCLP